MFSATSATTSTDYALRIHTSAPATAPARMPEQKTDLDLRTGGALPPKNERPLPGYVVNMPFKVDSDDEGESSSDEEANGRFSSSAFQNPNQHFQLLPKDAKTQRGTIILPAHTPEALPASEKKRGLSSLLPLFEKEFAKIQSCPPDIRAGICVGFNKMRSLSQRRNGSLWRCLNEQINTTIPIKKIGFLWDGIWQQNVNGVWVPADYETVRHFYKQLKRVSRREAVQFRETVEKHRAHMVPYREIRDCIKNHDKTKELTRSLKATNNMRDVYILFLDNDIKSFHHAESAPGALTVFDRNYLSSQFVIASTGYTISEPDNRALEIGVLADLAVRNATAMHVKRGVYFPEPCTAVQIPRHCETVPEDFSDPGDRNYPFPKEMPQLINKVLKGRQLDSQKAMVFDAQGAIVTTLPDRMERAFSCQSSQKKGIILWGLSDFKTMRSISQTHYHARDWAKRILEALTPKGTVPIKDSELKDKKVIQDALVSLLSRLFKAFDPVKLAERIATGDGLAFQASLIKVLKSYEVSLASLNGAIPRCDKKRTERKLVDQESASQKNQLMHTFREQIDSIDTIQGLVQTLRQLLTNDLSNNVLLAAHTSGVALAELFREHFCLLDYPRSVVRAISELISEDYNVVNGRIPPHYKAIAADASITRSGSTSMLANLDADFFKITPLHMAAIAGNLPVASWLIKKAEADLTCLTMDEDQKRLVPFDYALAYCKDNGVNLDLLRILSHGDFSGEIQEKVCERIDDDSDKVLVLEKFRAQFGNHIITEPDEELFILAILQGYDELANLLFDKTSADSRSAFLSARMDARAKGDLETAQRLSNWVKKHYPSLQLIDETLSEASLGCNKEALENKYSGT